MIAKAKLVDATVSLMLALAAMSPATEGAEATLVKDINPFGPSDPTNLRNADGRLFFTADDGVSGPELWRSEGTDASTVKVRDIQPGPAGAYPRPVTGLAGGLLFSANDGVNGFELWKSDGTGTGTALVKDLNPGPAGSDPGELTETNGRIFFSAYTNSLGTELWKSDGTAEGTVLVKDVNPGSSSSNPTELTEVSGTLYFRADDGLPGANHRELWKSDGTQAGTVMVRDINPGPGESYPANLIRLREILLFAANDGVHGTEIWKSNGTEAGTVMVKDINPGPIGGGFSGPAVSNGTAFFVADDGIHGAELWKSDGTETGTVMVRDINPSGSSSISQLTDVNGTLFFAIFDDLWKSDGTAVGTVMVKDFDSSNYPLALDHLTNVNGTLFFVANDGVHGAEVWLSNGTETGTALAADINPGDKFSFSWPKNLTAVNGTLFLQADDGTHGTELWSIGPSVPGAVPDGDGIPGTPLRMTRGSGTEIMLAWDPSSCAAGAADYAIYEGALGLFASHTPRVCSTGGTTTWTLTPDPGGRYYLVVPIYGAKEGSYGRASDGSERAQGTPACSPQSLSDSCYY